MAVFELFLEFTAFLLSLISIGMVYFSVKESTESSFVPIYYFLALTLSGVMILSISEIMTSLFGSSGLMSSELFKDLFLSYIALFLFGSIWQSYEAEMAIPPFVENE